MSTPPSQTRIDPARRRMSVALLVLAALALLALVAVRLSSPLLLFAERQPHGTDEIPYGLLMVSLAVLSGLVPVFDGGNQNTRALAALGVGLVAGIFGSPFLPLGGYDFYARDGLYTFSFLAGVAFFIATMLAAPRRGPSAAWWGFACTVAVALAVLCFMFWNARPGVVMPGPAFGSLKGPVRCRVVRDPRPSDARLAKDGSVDLGPQPGGGPAAQLRAANLANAMALTIDGRVAWQLRTPLGYGLNESSSEVPVGSALLWAKWTDTGGVLFAVTRFDWRNPGLWQTGPEYQIITVYRVGP